MTHLKNNVIQDWTRLIVSASVCGIFVSNCKHNFWRYLTRGFIWHLSQSSIRPSTTIMCSISFTIPKLTIGVSFLVERGVVIHIPFTMWCLKFLNAFRFRYVRNPARTGKSHRLCTLHQCLEFHVMIWVPVSLTNLHQSKQELYQIILTTTYSSFEILTVFFYILRCNPCNFSTVID